MLFMLMSVKLVSSASLQTFASDVKLDAPYLPLGGQEKQNTKTNGENRHSPRAYTMKCSQLRFSFCLSKGIKLSADLHLEAIE